MSAPSITSLAPGARLIPHGTPVATHIIPGLYTYESDIEDTHICDLIEMDDVGNWFHYGAGEAREDMEPSPDEFAQMRRVRLAWA